MGVAVVISYITCQSFHRIVGRYSNLLSGVSVVNERYTRFRKFRRPDCLMRNEVLKNHVVGSKDSQSQDLKNMVMASRESTGKEGCSCQGHQLRAASVSEARCTRDGGGDHQRMRSSGFLNK